MSHPLFILEGAKHREGPSRRRSDHVEGSYFRMVERRKPGSSQDMTPTPRCLGPADQRKGGGGGGPSGEPVGNFATKPPCDLTGRLPRSLPWRTAPPCQVKCTLQKRARSKPESIEQHRIPLPLPLHNHPQVKVNLGSEESLQFLSGCGPRFPQPVAILSNDYPPL